MIFVSPVSSDSDYFKEFHSQQIPKDDHSFLGAVGEMTRVLDGDVIAHYTDDMRKGYLVYTQVRNWLLTEPAMVEVTMDQCPAMLSFLNKVGIARQVEGAYLVPAEMDMNSPSDFITETFNKDASDVINNEMAFHLVMRRSIISE